MHTLQQPWVRYVVRLHDLNCLGGGTLEVTTVNDPSVRILRQWIVPHRAERFALVSYCGRPWEWGYEVQIPVLLPGELQTRVVNTLDEEPLGTHK